MYGIGSVNFMLKFWAEIMKWSAVMESRTKYMINSAVLAVVVIGYIVNIVVSG